MRFQVITLDDARDDIERLYEFNLERATTWKEMDRALKTTECSWASVKSLADCAPRVLAVRHQREDDYH